MLFAMSRPFSSRGDPCAPRPLRTAVLSAAAFLWASAIYLPYHFSTEPHEHSGRMASHSHVDDLADGCARKAHFHSHHEHEHKHTDIDGRRGRQHAPTIVSAPMLPWVVPSARSTGFESRSVATGAVLGFGAACQPLARRLLTARPRAPPEFV